MKSNQFIKLRRVDNTDVFINSQLIVEISEGPKGTFVITMNGTTNMVNESVKEVFKLIDDTNKITFKNFS